MACIRRRNNFVVRDALFARAALQREERDDRFDRRQEARLSDMPIADVEQRAATIDIRLDSRKTQTISQPPQVYKP